MDGELVAMDPDGRLYFNLLQNLRSAETKIHYFAFDVLIHKGKRLIDRPLAERREILKKIAPVSDHVSPSVIGHSADQMLQFVRKNALEGIESVPVTWVPMYRNNP